MGGLAMAKEKPVRLDTTMSQASTVFNTPSMCPSDDPTEDGTFSRTFSRDTFCSQLSRQSLGLETTPEEDAWSKEHQQSATGPSSAPVAAPSQTEQLRFEVGSRVLCNVGGWMTGQVVEQWYRDPAWQWGKTVPYQVKLDDGPTVVAPIDSDRCIKEFTGILAHGKIPMTVLTGTLTGALHGERPSDKLQWEFLWGSS